MTIPARAAVVHHPGGPFVMEDVELDDPRPDEVLVRMVGCGICHTDIAARDGLFGSEFPAVFGHEGAGVVEDAGTAVKRLYTGDKVVISFSSCGKCPECRRGHPAHCLAFDTLNFGDARSDGSPTIFDAAGEPIGGCFFGQSSFACRALARERNVVRVDAESEDELAMLAPLGCGIQAGAGTVLNELKPAPGESLAVFGAGTVGMSALMAARLAGANPIVAVDVVPARLDLARELGASLTLDGRTERLAAQIRNGIGPVTHAVDTTGVSRVIREAFEALGPGGRLSLLAVSADEGHITEGPASRGRRAFFSVAGDSDPQRFIPLLIGHYRTGGFPLDRLVREYPFPEINEAVRDSLRGAAIKAVLRFK